MDINIKGNPGTGNTFQEIHIGTVQNYNPNATTVINNIGTRGEEEAPAKRKRVPTPSITCWSKIRSALNPSAKRF